MMKRSDLIQKVADDIRDHLKPEIDAVSLATELVDSKDRPDDAEEINLEVPARYTVLGNPIVSSYDNYYWD